MERFVDFNQNGDKDIVFNFRTGMTTFGNALCDGVFLNLGCNGAGYNVRNGMMVSHGAIPDIEEKCGFLVELDGQSLVSHWEYVGSEQKNADGVLEVRIKLKHKIRDAEVTVCTKYDGSPCISRWIEVTNTSDKNVTLGRLAPMSGMLETTKNWRKLLREKNASCYRLGYFENVNHMHEGQFKWHELHTDCYSFGGRYSRERYRHPFFVLQNLAKGTTYAAQLAYSGGYKFSFDFNPDLNDGNLAFIAEIDTAKPLRILKPNETVICPELIISMVNGDLDDAVNAMHAHIRKSVMKTPHGPGCYLETACSGEINAAKKNADIAKERGFDILYIDAGWYFPMGKDALANTGKWDPDPERFPNGIRELSDYCHSIGIKFGLWMEPERVGSECPIADEEKDKYLNNYNDKNQGGHPIRNKGGLYDLSRKDVCDYIEGKICKLIDDSGIDMFRLDFNLGYIAPFCYNMEDGYLVNADFGYCENFCSMFGRIREKYPNVIFENCASGGGRTDLGTVKYFDHTWVTDNPMAPRCFAITNGMTMCLPPELVDRLVTTMGAPDIGSLPFDLYQLMFVRPTSHFPRETPENPLQVGKFRQFMDIYENFAKKMLPTCRIYHHTPSQEDCEPKGIGIIEEVSDNSDKAMLGVFALCDPESNEQLIRFKGIDASKTYNVRMIEANESFTASGYDLKYKGLTVMLHGALTAELILLDETGNK